MNSMIAGNSIQAAYEGSCAEVNLERPLILRLDVSGIPQSWTHWQEAINLHCRGRIAWSAGEHVMKFTGGVSRLSGRRSCVHIASIIAVKRHHSNNLWLRHIPPLTNSSLFTRDANLCMYCGNEYSGKELTRDHVLPVSKGGKDFWSNVVTACHNCNTHKGGRTPEEAGMKLVAIPYVPDWAEYLVLSNRCILADQMEFLASKFSRKRRRKSGRGSIT
ncbi:MAG: HNH endonuclease [Candidatus Porifericomitaceae bacterium WSBS_2022_MAG_OTU9]